MTDLEHIEKLSGTWQWPKSVIHNVRKLISVMRLVEPILIDTSSYSHNITWPTQFATSNYQSFGHEHIRALPWNSSPTTSISVKHMRPRSNTRDRVHCQVVAQCQFVGSRKVMRFKPINLVSSSIKCGGWAMQYIDTWWEVMSWEVIPC